MRAVGSKYRHEPRKVGESAVATCLLLLLLTIVALVATYSAVHAVYGGTFQDTVVEEIIHSEKIQVEKPGEVEVSQNFCRGMEHVELWGESVKWGTDNLVDTPEECCAQCKEMCPGGADGCECNSWVYCENKDICGEMHKQCWLKRQSDVLRPDVHAFTEAVGWTSGIIHAGNVGIIQLESSEGNIRMKLFPSWAPYTVNYIRDLLALRHCTGCQLYRGEGLGSGWNAQGERISSNPPGPPYALLQGSLYTDGIIYKPIPLEAAPIVKRGHVCLIGEGPDFFISLADHAEWGNGHTVFGEVIPEDMAIVEKIVQRPTKTSKWGEVEVQEFEEPLSFLPKKCTP